MAHDPDDWESLIELGARRPKARIPYARALELARAARRNLKPLAEVVVITGSIRRRELAIGDVELVVLPKDLYKFLVLARGRGFTGGERILRTVEDGLKVEVYLAHHPDELGGLVLWTTGDFIFNTAMNSRAKSMGYRRNPYGIWKGKEPVLQSPDEREFFDFLGMDWHEPEERSLATRVELQKLLRRLHEEELTRKDAEYVQASGRALREDKYLPLPDQERLGRLGKKYLKGRAQLGSEELIELGADPREWSPHSRPPMKALFPGMEYRLEAFRRPDHKSPILWIWYGAEGPAGDVATTVEIDRSGYIVCEYQGVEGVVENPPAPILKLCVEVTMEFLAEALQASGLRVEPQLLAEDPHEWAKYAAHLGVAAISYNGGSEEWVDALP